MHLISRSIQQSVVIDDDIHVTILDIQEDRVVLEVHSPSSKVPYRIETLLVQSEDDENLAADSIENGTVAPELVGASA